MNELIQDHGLKNWIKACIGLRCVRDGMLPFIEEKCGDLYSGNKTYTTQFCQLTNYSCTSCSLKELRPNHSEDDCPIKSHKINCGCKSSANKKICQNLGSCGVLFDLILDKHVNKAPRWNNSDCSKWYKNGWEQMKCFIDIPGYNDKEHLSQADITAFVHICQNNIALKDLFRTDIDKLIQVRADRNEIYHSGKMDISDDELKEYIAHMRDALRLSVFNKTDTQKFLDTLTKLETDNNFEIDATQEMIARKDALNALIEESKTLHEENTNIAENTTAIKHRIAAFAVVQDKHMKCITDHLTKIKCHMKSVKEEHNKTAEVLLQHSNDLKTITSAIDQHTTCFKNLQRELVTQTEIIRGIETISMGIERIVTKNYRMISEIQPEINTILLTVEKMYQLIQDTANIQGKIVFDINGIPNKAELLQEIVQLWNSFKTNPGLNASDEIGHCLSVTECELEKEGIKVDSVQYGSVEICFRCTSIPNWIKLCEKCIDGRMAKLFWPLQNHLKSKNGFENLKIAVNMYETDFVESVEAIVKQLYPKLITKFPNFVKSESDSDPTQIKWNDVLRLVLEDEKSRAPASQIPEINDDFQESGQKVSSDSSHYFLDMGRDVSADKDSDKDEETADMQSAPAELISDSQDVSSIVSGNVEHTGDVRFSTISNVWDVSVTVPLKDEGTDRLQYATIENIRHPKIVSGTVSDKNDNTEDLQSATSEIVSNLLDVLVAISDEDEITENCQSANAEIISNSRDESFTVYDNDDYTEEVKPSTAEISSYWRERCEDDSDVVEHNEEKQPRTSRLQRIPDILLSLAETLCVDSHIKDNAKQLVEKLAGTCQQFDTMICNEFQDVFLQMEILFTTMNADNVNIPKLRMALSNGSCAIVSIRDKLMAIQFDVHQDIETCRETVKNKWSEVYELNIEITLMGQEVRLLQGEISELKNEARSLADSAERKYDEAVEATAKKHNLVGGVGLAAAFTGLCLETVTGGGSLVATAIGGAVAGASQKEASELMKRYIRDKEKSKEKDYEATRLQSAAKTKQQTINEKRKKITTANSDINRLNKDVVKLQTMIDYCCHLIDDMNQVLSVFQDAETTLKSVHVHSASFTVAQDACKWSPEKNASFAEKHLQILAKKWQEMNLLLHHRGIHPN